MPGTHIRSIRYNVCIVTATYPIQVLATGRQIYFSRHVYYDQLIKMQLRLVSAYTLRLA